MRLRLIWIWNGVHFFRIPCSLHVAWIFGARYFLSHSCFARYFFIYATFPPPHQLSNGQLLISKYNWTPRQSMHNIIQWIFRELRSLRGRGGSSGFVDWCTKPRTCRGVRGFLPREILKSRTSEMRFPAFWGSFSLKFTHQNRNVICWIFGGKT
jgi:hypothetical protein